MLHSHTGLGECPRLVDAHDVHAGENFHRRHVLNQHLALGKANSGNSHGNTGEEHETLWDHRDDSGNSAGDCLAKATVIGTVLRDEQRDSDGEQCPGNDLDEALDGVAEF